ncbi:hypothetical protein OG871_39875 (plasmid) [Kitasatospora sp. NBC_00374]|uniref:hypothetical protein n=1 Tax=Kitasatospora sp. NBC_00374 TaxID=2975964 RepID=UPI002F919EE5
MASPSPISNQDAPAAARPGPAVNTPALSARHTRLIAEQIRALAGPVAEAVEQLAGPLPTVRTLVTGRVRGALASAAAEASAIGGLTLRARLRDAVSTWWMTRRNTVTATCVLADDGVLIVVFAPALRAAPGDVLVEVFGHELVHAAQVHRPGRREERLEDLRSNHGITKRPPADSYRAESKVCLEEAQAHELEAAIKELTGR